MMASARVPWHAPWMKRIGTWAFYAISTLAILYLAFYAYAVSRPHGFTPGKPIQIYRNPDAPSYS